jgi:hypothetical protein
MQQRREEERGLEGRPRPGEKGEKEGPPEWPPDLVE